MVDLFGRSNRTCKHSHSHASGQREIFVTIPRSLLRIRQRSDAAPPDGRAASHCPRTPLSTPARRDDGPPAEDNLQKVSTDYRWRHSRSQYQDLPGPCGSLTLPPSDVRQQAPEDERENYLALDLFKKVSLPLRKHGKESILR